MAIDPSVVAARNAEAAAKILAIDQERALALKAAEDHEIEARKSRAHAMELKREREDWVKALSSGQVQQAVETAQQAAEKAKQAAEAHEKKAAENSAEVEKMKAELAETLAKAKADAEILAKAAADADKPKE